MCLKTVVTDFENVHCWQNMNQVKKIVEGDDSVYLICRLSQCFYIYQCV